MLSLTIKTGEAIAIGDVAYVKVLDKSGQRVRLVVASPIRPIHIIASGIIPQRFTTGLTGEREPVRALVG